MQWTSCDSLPGDPRRVEVPLPVRLVVDDVPLGFRPRHSLDEELLGHLPGVWVTGK